MGLRKIIHVDMDAFYASVEQRDNPQLRGRPVAVGHDGPRGVVAAASYEARRYGVRSAMPSVKAKRICPDLIFVEGRMNRYKEVSEQVHEIFHEYTDLVEPISLDEAFLDVTVNKAGMLLAVDIAREIKSKIKSRLNLVASAGVSYNKFLAKVASDYRKPDGLCTIHPSQAQDFIDRLPIEDFWGVGPVTAKRMHALGIHTGAALRACSLRLLTLEFGKSGKIYYDFARGTDMRPVTPERERKSLGCEITLEEDAATAEAAEAVLHNVAADLTGRLSRKEFKGRTLTLKIRFNDFTQITRSLTVDKSITTMDDILSLGRRLLASVDFSSNPIRLMGLTVSHSVDTDYTSMRVKSEPTHADRCIVLSDGVDISMLPEGTQLLIPFPET